MFTDTELVTIDLDSTIADTGHRHHLIDRENGTDWDAYSAECVNDLPMEGMITLVKILVSHGVEVHALSGRKHSALAMTVAWFQQHDIPVTQFWLDESGEGDYVNGRTHKDYKLERALEVQKITGKKIRLHFDDHPTVADTFSKAGIPTVCVSTPQYIEEVLAEAKVLSVS